MSGGRLDPDDADAVARFIEQNTRPLAPPLVPEMRLYLAEESLPIWQKSEDELGEINVPPPFWAFAWAGGQAMARYLFDHPDICAGKSVLDLGAGSGLSGIAAAMAGSGDVIAADVDRLALIACRMNARLNGVELATEARDLLAGPPPAVDLVLVSDLFYDRRLSELVQQFIAAAKLQGSEVLIGDPRRSYFPEARFERLAEYPVPVTRELEDAEIKRSAVWRA